MFCQILYLSIKSNKFGVNFIEVTVMNKEQQFRLEEYLREHPSFSGIGINLSLYMGLRIGEVCALQWSDIDLEKRILTVSKTIQRVQCRTGEKHTKLIITEPKSESSKRVIPIPDCLLPMLRQFKDSIEVYVVSGKKKPVEPRTMQYRFAKILHNADLPSFHYHSLRQLFATRCVELGFDVKTLSEILGHSSVEVTLNRYMGEAHIHPNFVFSLLWQHHNSFLFQSSLFRYESIIARHIGKSNSFQKKDYAVSGTR